MKLLTAAVDGDPAGWSWTIPGELVLTGDYCDLANDPNHDEAHDCLSSFIGVVSGKATTCAQVAELDCTKADLIEIVRGAWIAADLEGTDQELADEVEEQLLDAAPWPVGTLLRRYRDELCPA